MGAESQPGISMSFDQHPSVSPKRTWYSKLLALCFVIFCFEVGVFLVVFPWLDFWDTNSLSTYSSWLADVWGNPYFRGALSGLGLVNIYISFLEILGLIRGQMKEPSSRA
jgi:hypothetical protein